MTVQQLLNQCEVRLDYLKNLRLSNVQLDNQVMVNKLDLQIMETEQTIEKLKIIL
jgi:hypothetical protein